MDNVSRASGIEDEGGVELARAVETLIDATRGARLSCVVDHHHKKGNDSLENKSRGGTGVAGAMDVNLELTRVGDWTSRRRTLSARGRLQATIWEKTIELTEDGKDYRLVEEPTTQTTDDAEAMLLHDRMTLAGLAREHGGKVTARQYAGAIRKSKDTAARRLDALADAGYATKEPAGNRDFPR